MTANGEYLWIVISGFIACFFMAFSIGGNDVANNFSTSVGSRSIQLWTAICLAAVLETFGATFLGGAVTDSIRTQILDFQAFENNEPVLLLGMLCSLIGAGLWLIIATRAGLPVSTTHSIIGALMGVGLASGNPSSIKWVRIGYIVLSWFLAPIASSLAGGLIFVLVRKFILRNRDSYKRAIMSVWIFIFFVSASFSFSLVFKNPFVKDIECLQSTPDGEIAYLRPCVFSNWASVNVGFASLISLGISVIIAIILSIMVYKLAFYRIKNSKLNRNTKLKKYQLPSREYPTTGPQTLIPASTNDVSIDFMTFQSGTKEFANSCHHIVDETDMLEMDIKNVRCGKKSEIDTADKNSTTSTVSMNTDSKSRVQRFKGTALDKWRSMPWFKDIHDFEMDDDSFVSKIGMDAEVFESKTEIFFSSCQVLSACLGCIAHSANDTANAIGPLAAIITVYFDGIGNACSVPWYILLFGGISMSLGLAIMGHRVIRTVGAKLVKITPSRGFCIDLGAAWIVLLFSYIGIPLSTTHCAIGSTLGLGLMEKRKDNDSPKRKFSFLNTGSVNWKLFVGIFISWIGTVAFSSIVSMLIFSFAAYSPSIIK